MPIWRCTAPRPTAAGPIAFSSRQWTHMPRHGFRWSGICVRRLSKGAFEIHYQPVVDLGSDQVTGCEALLRWRHPERGMISPAEFIPVAEETGLIVELGEWVLRTACAEAAGWPAHIRLAVNVSPV